MRQKQAAEARKAAAVRAKAAAEPARQPAKAASAATHEVQSGDTLYGIAHTYGTTVRAIQQANGGADKLKSLRVGQVIRLPEGKAAKPAEIPAAKAEAKPARAAVPASHTVESGDTLSRIARKYGITVRELQQANGGADRLKTLRIGQKLNLPGAKPEAEPVSDAAAALSELKAAQNAPAKPAAPKAPQAENYKVQSGDSVWAITHRFGMSEAEFRKLNPSVDSSSMRVGDTVKIIRKK